MSALASDAPGRDARRLEPAGHPLLQLTGITKRFGRLRVLDGIDLSIGRGELLALVGENGAGKSTIVKCIAGVVTPDTGSMLLDGEPLTSSPSGLQAHDIAVVWQDLAFRQRHRRCHHR